MSPFRRRPRFDFWTNKGTFQNPTKNRWLGIKSFVNVAAGSDPHSSFQNFLDGDLGLGRYNVAEWRESVSFAFDLIRSDRAVQFQILMQPQVAHHDSHLVFFGSFLTKSGPVVQAKIFRVMALVGSEFHRHKPVSFCYFPAFGLLVFEGEPGTSVPSALLLDYFGPDSKYSPTFLEPAGESTFEIGLILNDGRPGHVVAEELRGFFNICKKIGYWVPLFIRERSAFLDLEILSRAGIPFETWRPRAEELRPIALFRGSERFGEGEEEDFLRWVRGLAQQSSTNLPPGWSINERVIYLAITSGETRAWVEEEETIEALIKLFQEKWGAKIKFVFDGMVGAGLTRNHPRLAELQLARIASIVQSTGLKHDDFLTLVGSDVFAKVYWAMRSRVFLSGGFTPLLWPSKIARAFGVVHFPPFSKTMHIEKFPWVYAPRVLSPNIASIEPRDSGELLDRGAILEYRDHAKKQSYSINPQLIVNLFNELLMKSKPHVATSEVDPT